MNVLEILVKTMELASRERMDITAVALQDLMGHSVKQVRLICKIGSYNSRSIILLDPPATSAKLVETHCDPFLEYTSGTLNILKNKKSHFSLLL